MPGIDQPRLARVDHQAHRLLGRTAEEHTVVPRPPQFRAPVAATIRIGPAPGEWRLGRDHEAAPSIHPGGRERTGGEAKQVIRAERIGPRLHPFYEDPGAQTRPADEAPVETLIGRLLHDRAVAQIDEKQLPRVTVQYVHASFPSRVPGSLLTWSISPTPVYAAPAPSQLERLQTGL